MGFRELFIFFLVASSFSQGSVFERSPGGVSDDDEQMHPSRPSSSGQPFLDVEDVAHWEANSDRDLERMLSLSQNTNLAQNIIFYLGDGMSVNTITAARILKGQWIDESKFGEEAELYMDTLPFTGLSKTYCSDLQVAESACTATAYLCGSKGNDGTIGVGPQAQQSNCSHQLDTSTHVHSILKWAQDAGKSTGVVTTARVTHASPAGTYAHVVDRHWENNVMVSNDGADSDACDDIAEQLVLREPGKNINVILGGGWREFVNTTNTDHPNGRRTDGKNLIEDWKTGKSNFKFVNSKSALLAADTEGVDYLLGLFQPSHLLYRDQTSREDDAPLLKDMVGVALKILSRNPKGFFLFVEGGRIDHAHHENGVQRALVETIEFDEAIRLGDEMTRDEDTLIVVTADHAHVMHFAGYPRRGNDILDLTGFTGVDGLPYQTLGYGNGPGWRRWMDPESSNCSRRDVTNDDFIDPSYVLPTPVPLSSETHGGDDVLIAAKGPFAHLYVGTHEQTFIPAVMQYAACIGKHSENCHTQSPDPTTPPPSSSSPPWRHGCGSYIILVSFILCFLLLTSCW